MALDINVVAQDMFDMVEEVAGTKKLKPGDLVKAMMKKYKDDGISKKNCKEAIRVNIDGEKLVYSYFNGTFVELPGVEGAAKALED